MVRDEDGQFKRSHKKECIAEGLIDLDQYFHCGNKECLSCNNIFKAYNQAMKDMKKE